MASDPSEEMCERLQKHRGNICRVEVVWAPREGGPRMNVKMFDWVGYCLEDWENSMILGTVQRPGPLLIAAIIENALGPRIIRSKQIGYYFANYNLRIHALT